MVMHHHGEAILLASTFPEQQDGQQHLYNIPACQDVQQKELEANLASRFFVVNL